MGAAGHSRGVDEGPRGAEPGGGASLWGVDGALRSSCSGRAASSDDFSRPPVVTTYES